MNTDDLISELARRVRPANRYAAQKRFAAASAAGLLASAAALSLWLGVGPDPAQAAGAAAFIFKSTYTAALAALSIFTAFALLRPDGSGGTRARWLAAPVAAAALFAINELVNTPVSAWADLIMGQDITACIVRISALASPFLIAFFWAARAFAPTNAKAAGGAIGLAAGSLGAMIYSFHCVESAACFIALWYTAAIALVGIAGMLLGSRLLRW
ncbi:MAG TPA: DUF1109 domain-containing protein [Parvularcula sp.]|nr:DUF1109 domain-containing protein [Parvularcula sp.]